MQLFMRFQVWPSRLEENMSTSPVGTRILNTFYPIHIGVIGGTPTRIIQLIIGMIPLILLFKGGIMWWNRRKLLQTQLPRKSSVIH
ncbi:PepSY domain-containing protein [Candidatus Nitrotoga fabula]|nr:PepSY-associated TM helix domain-containing protein [Candidatus Nitrotoga fabula]